MVALISEPVRALPAVTAGTAVTPELIAHLTGEVVAARGAQTITSLAPFTLEPLATIPAAGEADVDRAFAIARAGQRDWAATPLTERTRVLERFHDLVLQHRAQGLDLVQAETGKARLHALEELLDVAVTARHYARTAVRTLAPKRHAGPFPVITGAVELRQPKGVVGVIAPWNYPLTLAVSDAMPALVAGNAVVLKPDVQTTLTALWAVDLLYRAGLPRDVLQVVAGPGAVLGPMIIDRADYMMFTGSTAVGRQVAQQCGQRLIGCSMELGGKNAMIVCEDANARRAAEIAERACFANAGQLCISVERMYVHEAVLDEFTDKFIARVHNLKLGPAQVGWEADIGSLASAKQLETVASHVEDARAKGATVLAGGRARPDIGPLFYEPTVLTDVTPDMICFGSETFGPVVSIYPVCDEAEAVELANTSPYGLNASVLTGDPKHGRRIASQLHAGTVNINEGYATAWGSTAAPMGGVGDSGMGRRHGIEGLLKYTESQTVATQRLVGWGVPPMLTKHQWGEALVMAVRALKIAGRR